MNEEQEPKVVLYEEWIAHPNERVFMAVKDHQVYAKNPGWWCTDWQGDEDAVRARGAVPRVAT